jgi:dienelactone hydrolase
MSWSSFRAAVAIACLFHASACSPSGEGNASQTGLPATAGTGFAGYGAPPFGSAGSGLTGTAGRAELPQSPSASMSGSPALPSAGSGANAGAAGRAVTVGTLGAAGSMNPRTGAAGAAGIGTLGAAGSMSPRNGAAGAAGSGSVPLPPAAPVAPGAALIREKDPTEQSASGNGEFTVKSYTETAGLIGGTAYGDAAVLGDGSELYYPESATPPFASIVIVPGFTAQRSDIAPWASFLASHGIVSLAIDSNTVGDLPDVRSQGLLDALASLKKENARTGSPIAGKLDLSRMAVMGWSMGGGGTWLTADSHPELKAAVSLCGWILDVVGAKTTVPSLQLAVRDDELAAGMSQPVYAAIPNATPKMLIEWASGGHWTNNTPSNQGRQVGRYGLAWLKVFLEGDDRYRQFFKTMPMAGSDFKTNQK